MYRSVRVIEPGEILSLSYLPADYMFISTELRQSQLLFSKYFTCQCPRCLGPDTCRLFKCMNEGCSGFISTSQSRVNAGDSRWLCDQCLAPFIESQLPIDSEKELEGVVLQLLAAGDLVDPESTEQIKDAALQVLGDRHWLFAASNRLLFEFYSRMFRSAEENWRQCFDVGTQAGEDFLAWSEKNVFPFYETHAAQFAIKLARHFASDDSAESSLRLRALVAKYSPTLAKIYGTDHEIFLEFSNLINVTD